MKGGFETKTINSLYWENIYKFSDFVGCSFFCWIRLVVIITKFIGAHKSKIVNGQILWGRFHLINWLIGRKISHKVGRISKYNNNNHNCLCTTQSHETYDIKVGQLSKSERSNGLVWCRNNKDLWSVGWA